MTVKYSLTVALSDTLPLFCWTHPLWHAVQNTPTSRTISGNSNAHGAVGIQLQTRCFDIQLYPWINTRVSISPWGIKLQWRSESEHGSRVRGIDNKTYKSQPSNTATCNCHLFFIVHVIFKRVENFITYCFQIPCTLYLFYFFSEKYINFYITHRTGKFSETANLEFQVHKW